VFKKQNTTKEWAVVSILPWVQKKIAQDTNNEGGICDRNFENFNSLPVRNKFQRKPQREATAGLEKEEKKEAKIGQRNQIEKKIGKEDESWGGVRASVRLGKGVGKKKSNLGPWSEKRQSGVRKEKKLRERKGMTLGGRPIWSSR